MSLDLTEMLAGAALALTILFGWLGARPARLTRGPRLMPWRFLMLAAFASMVALLVHIVNLLRGG